MKTQNGHSDKYLKFLYIAALSWVNVYVFYRLAAQAASFARTYVSIYDRSMSHFLILLFSVAFFLLFRNLVLLTLAITNDDSEGGQVVFRKIAMTTVMILLASLILQTLPEFLLTESYQRQGF